MTVERDHTDSDGTVQTFDYLYRCCGNSGSLFGAIMKKDAKELTPNLCTPGVVDYCGIYGANMESAR
jgi:hypothetical protein